MKSLRLVLLGAIGCLWAGGVSPAAQPSAQDVEALVGQLASGEPEMIRAARRRLLEPLDRTDLSARERIAYGDVVVPALARLMASESRELVLANALRVAGSLGTESGVGLIRPFLSDERTAVRFAAAYGVTQTFEALKGSSPALPVEAVMRLVDDVAASADAESDPLVLDAMVRALIAASELPGVGAYARVRNHALGVLADVGGRRARALGGEHNDPRHLLPLQRVGQALRNALVDHANRPIDEATARRAAGYAGDVLSMLLEQVRRGRLPEVRATDDEATRARAREQRRPYEALAALAEAIIDLAGEEVFRRAVLDHVVDEGGRTPAQNLLRGTSAGDREFSFGVLRIIGDAGVLTDQPFQFADDRFIRNGG